VASLKVLGVVDVEASSRRSMVRVYSSVPSNTPLERTIGVGISVEARRRSLCANVRETGSSIEINVEGLGVAFHDPLSQTNAG